MKRLAVILCVVASVVCANAKILRVSNVNGSTAPYSTIKDALEAAEDGDVIMVDASPDSYGDVEINKTVTLQGPGYWLIDNGIVQEGMQTVKFGNINITAFGVKMSSISVNNINCKGNGSESVITRCQIGHITFENEIKGAIIHQNYISSSIGNQLNFPNGNPSNIQITNNIFRSFMGRLGRLSNSIIKYNTFAVKGGELKFWRVENCVFENNISDYSTESGDNTFVNNIGFPKNKDQYYDSAKTDASFVSLDAAISTEHGAFAGDDPYVISGIAPGPYIEDITVPVSVAQGNEMKVTVKIGTSR